MVKFIFYFFIIMVASIYFGYPLILSILSFFMKAQKKAGNGMPSLTLIIPAYNEEEVIRQKIENSLSLDYPKDKFEVLLVSDKSSDRTDSIARGYLDKGLKLICQEERKGKIAALNLAVIKAQGEILVFTDANSMYERDALKKLARNFSDEKIGCVCGELKYELKDDTSIEKGQDLYWRYEKLIKARESFFHALLVTNGSIYAMRSKLYEPVDEDLADDFVNPMRIAKKGYGIIYEAKAFAVEKISSSAAEQFKQKSRIVSQGWKATFRLWNVIFTSGPLRVFEFLFHKFLRWLMFLFMTIIFVSNLFLLSSGVVYQILFVLQSLFYFFALIGLLLQIKGCKIKLFYFPFYFCVINASSLKALFIVLKGEETRVWEKAESTR